MMGWRDVLKRKEPSAVSEISEIPEIMEAQTGNVSDISHISVTREGAKAPLAEPALESTNENCAEFFSERAAIMEFDGGLSRADAEAAAYEATERHRRECWERFKKAADAFLNLPTWEAQRKAIEHHRELYGETGGQEMNNWITRQKRIGARYG